MLKKLKMVKIKRQGVADIEYGTRGTAGELPLKHNVQTFVQFVTDVKARDTAEKCSQELSLRKMDARTKKYEHLEQKKINKYEFLNEVA